MAQTDFLHTQVKPLVSQKRFSRLYVPHPLHLGSFAMALILQATGMIADEFREWDSLSNVVWTAARHTVYLTALFFVQPYILRYFALRRIPFVWVLIFAYTTNILIYMALFGSYVSQFTHVPTYMRAINNIVIALPFIFALAGVFGKRAALSVFDDPALYPTWRRYKPTQVSLDKKFPIRDQSSIRYLQAWTPNTEIVTAKKTTIVPISFKQALDILPEDLACVHRSYWISHCDIQPLIYIDDNPHIVLKQGEVLPVSRKIIGEIKASIERKILELPQ